MHSLMKYYIMWDVFALRVYVWNHFQLQQYQILAYFFFIKWTELEPFLYLLNYLAVAAILN